MRVIATSAGYDNVVLRGPGDEFEMPEGSAGSWFRALDSVAPAAPPPADHHKVKLTKAQKAEIDTAKAQNKAGVGTGEDAADMI